MTIEAELAALRAEVAALTAQMQVARPTLPQEPLPGDMPTALPAETLENARAVLRQIRSRVEQMEAQLEAGLHDHPVQASLMAFGLGVLLARLWRH